MELKDKLPKPTKIQTSHLDHSKLVARIKNEKGLSKFEIFNYLSADRNFEFEAFLSYEIESSS